MKKKILYHTLASTQGGPPLSLLELLSGLDKEKYEPFVLLPPDTCDFFKKYIAKENIHSVPMYWSQNWLTRDSNISFFDFIKFPWRIIRRLKNAIYISNILITNNIDIVHTNIELTLDVALGAKIANIPHVWHIRAPIGPAGVVSHPFGMRYVAKVMNFLSDRFIVNSIATWNSIRKFIPDSKVDLIYNGVNIDNFCNSNGKYFRREFKIPNYVKIVGTVSCASPHKNTDVFVNLAANILMNRKDVIFVFVGNGENKYLKQLKEKINILNINENIIFTGSRTDVINIISEFDIFVQPMLNGSWGRPVIEAMAAGKPVVAWESNMLSEAIEHGKDGFLVSTPTMFPEVVLKLLNSPDLVSSIGIAAKKKVRLKFSHNDYLTKIMSVYSKLS